MKKYINLLPPIEQRQIRLEKTRFQILNFGAEVVLSLVTLAVLLFVAELLLQNKVNLVESEVEGASVELNNLEQEILREDIEVLNLSLDNFQALDEKSQNWSRVLKELGSLIPAETAVDRLVITREGLKIEMAGRAASRNAALKLRQNLLGSEYFKNVNFPLSNLEKPTDVKWNYRFFVKEDKLK